MPSPLLIATGEAIPLRGLEGVPGLPGAPQDEAGLTRKCETSHVVFLELRRDSRVTTGISGFLLYWPREA